MNDWLVEQLEASRKSDKANMIFRPFLRWIDKSLEQFFTNGLLKVRICSMGRGGGHPYSYVM